LAAMDAAIKLTPPDAVIWTTWELGYPLMHYGRRRTVADGIHLEGERLVYVYRPLATNNPRLAANLMRFQAAHGLPGLERIHEIAAGPLEGMKLIERLMAAGPESARPLLAGSVAAGEIAGWIDFLFPRETAPVYLLLHRRLATALDWFEYGSWDLERGAGQHAVYKPYHELREQGGTIFGPGNLRIDTRQGGSLRVTDDRGNELSSTLARIVVHTGERVEAVDLDPAGELHFEWIRPLPYGALMTRDIAESLFNRLYIRHQPDEHFRSVALRTPAFQLWEVVGD